MRSYTRDAPNDTLCSKPACAAYLRKWQSSLLHARSLDIEFPNTVAIGRPKLDHRITESLVVHALNDGSFRGALPDLCDARRGFGHNAPDLELSMSGGRLRRGETKAAGPAAWQRASAKDAAADVFIYLSLRPLLLGEREELVLYCVLTPARYLRAGQDWRSEEEFVRICAGDVERVVLPIAWLDASLSGVFARSA